MFVSVFDMFKIGIGPSSSHTMGPMVAANNFLDLMRGSPFNFVGVRCRLHGSLAFTGVGHATDRAITLGLAGFTPENYEELRANEVLTQIHSTYFIYPDGLRKLKFNISEDLIFDYGPRLDEHPNGMIFYGVDSQGDIILQETYFSIGGGFVLTKSELTKQVKSEAETGVPYPFKSAVEMLEMARKFRKSIAEMKRENEKAFQNDSQIKDQLSRIWNSMDMCIKRGLKNTGRLPGGLNVKRRAKGIYDSLISERGNNLIPPHTTNDWMSVYAMAVNEENAAGGQVVTAPTNGAAGVVPSVLRYYLDHVPTSSPNKIEDFLLTAAAIGGLVKFNASISGAEAGCQAEVGSASAMAAAGFCAVMGGTPEQIENAAEIALEHHLGMTCDPVKGLVQVPCIERNGLGAIKAISAASLALRGDGTHIIPLDACIETMRQTGEDMSERYKETSMGGLAVNVPNC
jgi:L-serine dehydratase